MKPVLNGVGLFMIALMLLAVNPSTGVFATVIEKIDVGEWPFLDDDEDLGLLRSAVSASISYYDRIPGKKFSYGEDSYTAGSLASGLRRFNAFLETGPTAAALNQFIKENGLLYGYRENNRPVNVLFTGYFEPRISGSLTRSENFRYPVYGRPNDLAVVNLSSFSVNSDQRSIVGRYDGKEVVPYFDRSDIEAGVLEGRAQVIAWVSDPVALFFLHVQGSGVIDLDDGRQINLHFNSSNGLPYKSIGRYLIDAGKIAASDMSMQAIADYLRANPEETEAVLHYNPRYIFFQTGEHGVRGCLNVPLTRGRSVALDQGAYPPGSLIFIKSSKPVCDQKGNIQKWTDFSRFALNQDTGSAIRGPSRADLFWGSGSYAEIAAGHMQHPGLVYFIVIRPAK